MINNDVICVFASPFQRTGTEFNAENWVALNRDIGFNSPPLQTVGQYGPVIFALLPQS